MKLIEEKDGLEIQSQKLAEEASYAKELAAAAAVELRNLAEEVTKLSYENAKLSGGLAAAKETQCRSNCCQRSISYDFKQSNSNGSLPDGRIRKTEDSLLVGELQKELNEKYQREASLEMALSERNRVEGELRKQLDEAKHHEEDLENELANMWVLVAKMRKSGVNAEDMPSEGVCASTTFGAGLKSGFLLSNGHSSRISKDETFENIDGMKTLEELKVSYQKERRKCKQLESIISRLKVFIFLTKLKLHNKVPFTAPG